MSSRFVILAFVLLTSPTYSQILLHSNVFWNYAGRLTFNGISHECSHSQSQPVSLIWYTNYNLSHQNNVSIQKIY
jgi:hypothetical protein